MKQEVDDPAPLPGPAQSWAPGEPPVGNADPASPYDALGVSDGKTKDVTAQMAATQREKIGATDKVYGQLESATDRLLPRIEQLSKDAGVEAGKMKPWNAEKEWKDRQTDPIEAFGSIGSVFGILASAFTHAPMENALNASAAAINSIKTGDEKSYNRAAKAWEDNWKLAMDRHKIQHEAYQDAVSLLQTNMAAANAKLQVLAARFGDKQTLTLLENGMSKDVQELQLSRHKLATDMIEDAPRRLKAIAEGGSLIAERDDPDNPGEKIRFNPQQPSSPESSKAYRLFQREQAELKRLEHPYYGSLSRDDALEVDRRTAKYEADGLSHEEARDKARTEIAKAGQKGGDKDMTTDRQRAQDVAAYREELKNEKNEDGTPKYKAAQVADMAAKRERELKSASVAPSGNRLDDLRWLRDRATMMNDTIGKMEALMAKHNFIAGLGGKIGRTAEAVSNIAGISNEADRAQFARYVNEMQEWGTRVLNEAKGRPLSTEVSKLQSILPGSAAGDTIANTIRAYREVKPLLERIQAQFDKRIKGDWEPLAPEKGNSGATKDVPPWVRDKNLQNKRSNIEAGSENA